MLSVILLVFYFCYFIVIEVNRNCHSFKSISPLLIGPIPRVNSSYPASLDQIWKTFAISSKIAQLEQAIAKRKGQGEEAALVRSFGRAGENG